MPIQVNNEEYYSVAEACDYLGGISSQTLRTMARKHNVKRYQRDLAPNIKYYRKVDLDKLMEFKAIEWDDNSDNEGK